MLKVGFTIFGPIMDTKRTNRKPWIFLTTLGVFGCFLTGLHLDKKKPNKPLVFVKPKSIYDIYDFTAIDSPKLWKNGNHEEFSELHEPDISDFLRYKEAQLKVRRERIQKNCRTLHSSKSVTSSCQNTAGT